MQMWPGEKCPRVGGWDRGQRTSHTQARTEISEDQKGEASNLRMLLEAEPALCLGYLNTTLLVSSSHLHSILFLATLLFLLASLLCLVLGLSVVLKTMLSQYFSSLSKGKLLTTTPFWGPWLWMAWGAAEQLFKDCAISH